jgi:hypothetical protein
VSLYLACLPPVLLLFGLAYGDLRETGTQVVKEHLDLDPEEMREIMKDPQLRDLLERAQQGEIGEAELSEMSERLDGGAPRGGE